MKLKRIYIVLTSVLTLSGLTPLIGSSPALAAGPSLNMIDDSAFDNTNAMSAAQIQGYLSTPNTTDFTNDQLCLANYQTTDANWNASTGWSYGGTVSAAQLIYKVAQFWGMNPQVILATLEKEEALPHGTNCSQTRFNSAMGYDCPSGQLYNYPDIGVTGTCVKDERYVGFTKQVLWGAFQLEFARIRAEGDGGINWQGNGTVHYVGYETAGTRARYGANCDANGANCQPGPLTSYDGQTNLCATDGSACQTWTLANGATASLVSYTPYYPQSFSHWFDETSSYIAGNPNIPGENAVYRLANYITHERLFTVSSAERSSINGKNGWVYEGIAFQVPQAGSIPVYRLANYITHERLFTTSSAEKDSIAGHNGWVYEQVAFMASPTDPNPVYRLANYITHERLFTTDVNEKNSLNGHNGWVYEQVAFMAQ